MKSNYIYIVFLSICISSCIPATQEPITKVQLDVNDPIFRKITDFQDRQELDSLLTFTSDFNPSYRFLVANALASFQSENGLDSLYKLLNDPVMKVRTAAAYAIGQIGDEKAADKLLASFKTKDTLDVDNNFNSAILEAIGKIGNERLLPSLATVSTYRNTDTLLLIGQSRAIYNYALRGYSSDEGTDRMLQYLIDENIPEKVRLIAVNYLFRAKEINVDNYKFQLSQVFTNHKNPYVRMALATILGKTKDKEVLTILQDQFKVDEDNRVKMNIMRAISNYPYIQGVDYALEQIGNSNKSIANAAASYLLTNGNRNDATIYKSFINDTLDANVQATMYEAIMKHLPTYYSNTRKNIKTEIIEKAEEQKDAYLKSSFLKALSYDPISYNEVLELTRDSKHAIVRSKGAEIISSMIKSDNFIKTFKAGQRRVKRDILEEIKIEIAKGDVGISSIYGELLAEEGTGLKPLIDSVKFISDAMQKLNLPKEIEAYNSLLKAQSHLTDREYTPKKLEFNHPINWSIYNIYGDSAMVAIKTEKGVIRIQLFANRAPGSVANFLTLADDDFYDGKNIHRVVPNFVIQGGCPRGDGYGGLDYSIRSEFPQMYYDEEGVIGMASAGPHTEGTQWFITHAPAMHLSGKYTIFGRVIDGMDVVHNIEVGDKILDVIITK